MSVGWYAPDGRRIDIEEAEGILGDDLALRVAHTSITTSKGTLTVSTVFLVLDHSFGEGPPVLWETMVFGGPVDLEQRRYTSRAEAEAGHLATVAWARTACDIDGAQIVTEETFQPSGVQNG